MTTAFLTTDIARDEGCRLTAYEDTVGVFTVGYGCTGEGIGPGTVWTQEKAQSELAARVHAVETQLDLAIPWWRSLSDARQDVLANMAYNLGIRGLLAFHHALAAIEAADWNEAAAQMLASHWAAQVGQRAKRLAHQMQTGERT